ncbi:hypothetical protein ACIG0C_03730 [Kitasatospora aureofaciens]|uniref:Integral membrane protein n=1 Tax=Kitasatospora aureofaciens TaxID=1894 RepID=A0A1E7MZL0_KITAU|nr:hypothetical protein [Kitasatospora aureofaciens]QEU99959.1 hypothetical protein CP971_12270 [Streptomyces viridifaciens]ARF78754.1 hypothetical protein B6264_07335 [Kitasatospora aureofaciens]OEV33869.1 hypothetical protein HS99_0037310 [Kitasatospora aureofaciens]UKZ06123.1 hypothetical protein BOQ63_019155 [Streptomyces viridifaciens]GGU77666.1 hypothetical protein GCM10010502_31980 [Kitasatospora aureofaciens]
MTAESSAPAPARPVPLTLGAAITALEGAALAVVGVSDMVSALSGQAKQLALNEFGGLVIVLLGVLPVLAARALLKERRWGRSPAVLTNSICLPVAYYMVQSGGAMIAVGVLVGLLGLVGIGALLNPKSTAALYAPRED